MISLVFPALLALGSTEQTLTPRQLPSFLRAMDLSASFSFVNQRPGASSDRAKFSPPIAYASSLATEFARGRLSEGPKLKSWQIMLNQPFTGVRDPRFMPEFGTIWTDDVMVQDDLAEYMQAMEVDRAKRVTRFSVHRRSDTWSDDYYRMVDRHYRSLYGPPTRVYRMEKGRAGKLGQVQGQMLYRHPGLAEDRGENRVMQVWCWGMGRIEEEMLTKGICYRNRATNKLEEGMTTILVVSYTSGGTYKKPHITGQTLESSVTVAAGREY